MQFSISREKLLQPLQSISGAVERRQTLPILSHIYIDVSDQNELTFIGTDLEVEIRLSLLLDGESTPGITTLPARKFSDLVKALPDHSEIKLAIDQNMATLRSGRSRFTLSTLSADDFPKVDELQEVASINELTQSQLKDLLHKTQFSMALQDVRYYLNGLLLELEENEIRFVSTDGHRLSYARHTTTESYGEKKQVIIPRKAIQELMRLLGESNDPVKLSIGTNHLQFTLGDLTMTTKLIDGRYPDYDRVIPKEGDRTLVANKELFRSAISRVSILSNEKYRGIRMSMSEESVAIHANNPEQEEAEEELQVTYRGANMEIGFNSSYMLDALSAVDEDEVTLYFIDENSSSLIHTESSSDEYKFVIMPMRL
jgi:DNA polymerase-3 subunit beta